MKSLSNLTPIFFVFFTFHHICHFRTATSTESTALCTSLDNITLIYCGGVSTATDGRDWTGDVNSEFCSFEEHGKESNVSRITARGTSTDVVPYTTARIFPFQFTYIFRVHQGQKFVRLYFNPVSYQGFDRSKAIFTVKSGSFTLLENFRPSFLNDSLGETTIVKEFCIIVEENQTLNLTFTPQQQRSSVYYAFINGIEIVSMPTDIYYTKIDIGLPYVGQGTLTEFHMYNSMALEMVFRLNVGGGLISPMDDTGMFREWSQDIDFFYGGGLVHHRSSLKPKFSKIPPYTAPDDVYRSARLMGLNQTKNLQSNLTWGLAVDLGFNYLVRLHFCETDVNVKAPGERRFTIYIDYQIAELDADVVSWTDYRDIAFYKDYVVMIQAKGVNDGKKHILSIDLHPRSDCTFYDAILNGIEVFKLSNIDGNLAKFDPEVVANSPLPVVHQPEVVANTPVPAIHQPTAIKSKTKKRKFIAIGIGTGFFALLFLMCCMVFWKTRKAERYGSNYLLSRCWCWLRLNSYKGKHPRKKTFSLRKGQCHHFSLAEIKIATNNFHKDLIIGVGGFGNVYKGQIDAEETMSMAIKRLNPESRQGAHEFRTEIEMLSQLRHVHLVSLIGYSNDKGEMILVYDYMINGTLREHLYDTNNDPLPWKKRLDICIGAARGLDYLHMGVKHTIIHRDVKTTNILLDKKWVAKVSDFGLSKMDQNNTAVSTMVKGTWGYLDPEYARRQKLSEKSDVYAFGVVLLEVLCARKALNQKLEEEQWNLAHWARKCIERGTINEIIDPYLKGKIAPKCFKVFVLIAESCTRDEGIQRPTMGDVVEKLKFALEVQENADAENESMNPGGEYFYSGTLSFFIDATGDGPWATNEHGMTSDSGTVTGLMDSITTQQDIMKNTTNV